MATNRVMPGGVALNDFRRDVASVIPSFLAMREGLR